MIRQDSLHGRLLTWLLLPLLALGGLMIWQARVEAWDTADRAFDRLLEAAALAIAEQVQWQDDQLWLDLPPAALEMLAGDAQERVFYALFDARGNFVTGNAALPGDNPRADVTSGHTRYRDTVWNGLSLRQGTRRGRLEDWHRQARFEVRVAHTREGRQRLAAQLLRGNLTYILSMMLVALGVLLIAIRAALTPLTRLRRAIRARDPRTLAPLELALPRELAELREALNELLARMRRVRSNQERFIGDASHQLRTPLAGLSTRAELALRQTEPRQWREALTAMRTTSLQASRLAMQLLSLTRLNNPEYCPERLPVDLNALAREAVKRHWSMCHRDGVDLGLETAEAPVTVAAVDWQLEEALANLIDNARRHGARRTTLRTRASPPTLEVEDDGPGIPAAQRLLMLRPFHRGSDDSQGSGLGLAIVDAIARAHGAQLSLDAAGDGLGLRVTLRFVEASS